MTFVYRTFNSGTSLGNPLLLMGLVDSLLQATGVLAGYIGSCAVKDRFQPEPCAALDSLPTDFRGPRNCTNGSYCASNVWAVVSS